MECIARFAKSLAVAVGQESIPYGYAYNLVERAAHCSSRYRHLTDDRRGALALGGVLALDDAIWAPGLAASDAVRVAISPMMRARKPRGEILLAAHRAGDGRLSASEVEAVVAEEISAFMARVRVK